MKKRDPELSKGWGQIVTPLSVQTAGGPHPEDRYSDEGKGEAENDSHHWHRIAW